MAFKTNNQILGFFLFIWFSFIKVSGFVVFNEGKKLESLGSFDKSALTKESSDRGDEMPKYGEQVGRLLVWDDQSSNSHGDGSDRFSSDLGFQSRPDEDAYQSGWMKLLPLWGQVYGPNTLNTPAVERLLDLKPKVDCVGDLMKLTVHGQVAQFGSSFLIDRGSLQPLPLSQLPSECGHRFLRTWRDFVFIIPYDGCYVSQEKDAFVLPLLWRGLPVKMSCSSPTLAPTAPSVSCYTNGMIVRLYSGLSENLKIKVMNEWQPLLKGSARCGYSLVSHAEGVVIHAPYMPCTEPKDGMFTLHMAAEKGFNLSCPALALALPTSLPDCASKNCPTSMPDAPVSPTFPSTTIITTPIQPISTSSTVQKLPTPPLPYYIPSQTNLAPVPSSYPFLPFPSKVPPTGLPQGPIIVVPPTAVTQRPQAPVHVKRPPTWYPWKPKPSFSLAPVPSQSPGLQYPKPLPPTKAPKTPLGPLLKPTSIPQETLPSAMPVVTPVQWAPMFPPKNLVYPLYPKPEFAPSTVFRQDPYSPYSKNEPGPLKPHAPPKLGEAPPMPAPTRKAVPQHFHPWYKPFPPRSTLMPPVPTKVPLRDIVSTSGAVASSSTTYQSVDEAYSINLESTYPTPSIPKLPEANTPAPINACLTPICLSHAHSFNGKPFHPCPPSVSYHHHNHHHFGHLPVFNLDPTIQTKISGQKPSSPISAGSTPFVQGKGYNYGLLSSEGSVVRPALDESAMQYLAPNPIINGFRKLEFSNVSTWSTMKPANVAPEQWPSRPLQNGPVAEHLVYSNQSLKPAVYQAEMERYVPLWGHLTQAMLAAPNKGPFFEKLVQYATSKPTMPPGHSKNVYMNPWYQAASNAKPPISDSPTKDPFSQLSLPQPANNPFEPSAIPPQPENSGGNLPVMNPLQYYSQSGDSVVSVFRHAYWVPAVKTNQDALLSHYNPDGF